MVIFLKKNTKKFACSVRKPKLLPKNAYFIAKFLKFADGDAEAPLSVFLFHYKYHFKEAEEEETHRQGEGHKP